jgi:peptidyl-prolyl cis-trans isomerase SurA
MHHLCRALPRVWLAALLGPALLLLAAAGPAAAQSSIRIVVNGEPITTYDVQQRTAMLRAFTGGREGESTAVEQLIDERLMLQEAERRNMTVSDAEVDNEFARRAAGTDLTETQFAGAMRQAGFEPDSFREFLRANMSWQQLVRARFRATIQITDQDVATALSGRDTSASSAASEYRLQQILFVVPEGSGASVETQRRSQANAFRSAFAGCESSVQQAGGAPGVVVKPEIRREESALSAALRQRLAALAVGGITEPERTPEGFELIAICARTAIGGQMAAEADVRDELSNERGTLMARQYLRDLRSDAVIEYR